MSFDAGAEKLRVRHIPQLRHGFADERIRLALLACTAAVATIVFGACCGFAWLQEPRVGSVAVIAMQVAATGLPWWWFAFRLIHYSFVADIKRDLARHGKPRDVMKVIDGELRSAPEVFVRGRFEELFVAKDDYLALSPNWLIQVCPFQGVAVRLDDLVWVYKSVVSRRVWIRDTTYRVQLTCRLHHGSVRHLEASEEYLDELAEELLERRPGLLVGWRGDNFDLAVRGPAELATVGAERAAEFAGLGPELQENWLDENYARYEGAVRHVE